MRNLHRLIMIVFGITVAYCTVSGLVIALYDAADQHQVWSFEGGGPGARLADFATTAKPIPDPASLAHGISIAKASAGKISIASVDLRMIGDTDDIPRLEFAEASGSRDTMGRYYALTGSPMTAQVADSDSGTNIPNYTVQRNYLKIWHRGNIVGLVGQFIVLITGLALIPLTVTGIIVYWHMWKARLSADKRAFFRSSKNSIWRRSHRWISIVSAVLVLNIAITGTILAYGEIQLQVFIKYHIGAAPYPRPTPLPPVSDGKLPDDVQLMLQTTYNSAHTVEPDGSITSIEIVSRNGTPVGLVTLGGQTPKTLAFNAETGFPVQDWATGNMQVGNGYFADWHQILKRFHRGDIIGSFNGRYIQIATGCALLYLVFSGFLSYFDMRRYRNASRK